MSRGLMRAIPVSVLVVAMLAAQPATQKPPNTPPEPIPLTQIAVRGEELSRTLREISRRLPADAELATFEEQFAEHDELVHARLKESSDLLASSATLTETREQAREWRVYNVPEARQRKVLGGWAAACEESILRLSKEQVVWQATLKSTTGMEEIEPVLARIQQALSEIEQIKYDAEERLRVVLDYQSRLSKQALAIADILEKLNEATHSFQGRMFHPDAHPIWRVSSRRKSGESFSGLMNQTLERSYSSSAAFVRSRPALLLGTILALALAFTCIRWCARSTLRLESVDPVVSKASGILKRPLSLAVLMAAPVVFLSLPLARMNIVLWLILLFLLPIPRLLPVVSAFSRRFIYFSTGFYALNGLVSVLRADPVVTRELSAAVIAAALIVCTWWGRPVRFSGGPQPGARAERLILRMSAAGLAMILLTNVFGFLLLSNLLRAMALLSSYVALVLYSFVRVAGVLVSVLLRLPRLSSLATIRLRGPTVMLWANRTLRIGALSCWVYVMLDLLALKAEVSGTIGAALNARIRIKAFSISLGDILGFVCILAVGYLIAGTIRFILREDVLSRLRLARGIPELISTSVYYVLLLLVFFLSLAAAGLQLDKLTVLTGAFGVGVGFGMQNVVNNFVSGLILLFERPIRVGDTLEVGTVAGEVRHIGIRSSTIRTFQGAEVIIPNSTFVSNQVTNWTLSETRRRVEITVGVAYGTGPERVIEILSEVAAGHPEVLRDPAPGAFFQGFGQIALEFILIFWTEQSAYSRVRSEIAIAVNAALGRAGIEMPVPQRDVRVRLLHGANFQEAAGGK